jgi:hypothetical protein
MLLGFFVPFRLHVIVDILEILAVREIEKIESKEDTTLEDLDKL